MTSSRGKASSRDVSRLVSSIGSTAEDPHRPALLSGCQQAAEAAHCRAREQKQVRDDGLSDTVLFCLSHLTLRMKGYLASPNKHTLKHSYY